MVSLRNTMLFNPRKLLLYISSMPATTVWFAWYFEVWNLMVCCLLLAVPIMIFDAFLNRGVRARVFEIAFLLFFYLPIILYAYAKLYEERGLIINGEIIHSFTDSIYFSVVTWTTLGYGDIQPSETIKLWAASEAFFGYIFMAIFIAFVMKFLSSGKK